MIEQLSVFLPGLLAPLREGERRHPIVNVEQTGLRSVFAEARARAPAELAAQLARYVGSAYTADAAAVAAALALPAASAWLFAAPVWLRPDHAGIYLLGSRPLQFSAADATACCAELNTWLVQDGMRMYPVTPSRWLLALPEACAVQWTPLADAIGCDLRQVAPQGEGNLRWQSRLTEWQMLLNQSPLNQARQQRRLPPVQSIWLWGDAPVPQSESFRTTTEMPLAVMANDSLLQQVYRRNSPESNQPLVQLLQLAAPRASVIDERLYDAFVHGDSAGYQQAFDGVWHDTLLPLVAATRSRQIGELQLYPDDGFVYRLRAKAHWQFWQRAPLPSLLQGR